MIKVVENYNKALKELYDHVGFTEDWVVYPIDDFMEHFWCVIDNDSVRYIEVEKLPKIEKFIDDGEYYEDEIYKQRFYKKWVYEGKDITMIFCNPGVDGMQWFKLFDNKLRIKDWDNAVEEAKMLIKRRERKPKLKIINSK